jgi:hypothetical protein
VPEQMANPRVRRHPTNQRPSAARQSPLTAACHTPRRSRRRSRARRSSARTATARAPVLRSARAAR